MAWIEAHQGLPQHPKTKRFARMLNISTREAVGSLFMLWWWALEYASDGDISKYDATDIADALQWDGDPEELVNALINCGPHGSVGFIEKTDEGIFLHDWDKYGGRLFEKREKNRIRQARLREKNASNENVARDESVINETATLPLIPEAELEEADNADVTLRKIIVAWNDKLTPLGFPSVLKNTPARDKALKARIGMSADRKNLAWWESLFERIASSDFLRNSAKERNWFTLDWLLNENNLVKVLEGKYDTRTQEKPIKTFDEILAGNRNAVIDAEYEVVDHDGK